MKSLQSLIGGTVKRVLYFYHNNDDVFDIRIEMENGVFLSIASNKRMVVCVDEEEQCAEVVDD